MKTITVWVEVPDEKALSAYHELLEDWGEVIISADEASLSVRVRQPE